MKKRDIIFQRLLDYGFYPKELPPTFNTKNFGATLIATPKILKPQKGFSGEVIFLDGATFQGNHRTFGVINPINYSSLSHYISKKWTKINKVMLLSKFSASQISFPNNVTEHGRSFSKVTFTAKRKKQAYLSSAYPAVVYLDINRFYGSIYTHSLAWAALGKTEGLKQHSDGTLSNHWSAKLDQLVRACNRNQTIGVPIGPDTSRIVSELVLSRIDIELSKGKSRLNKKQVYHSIDDYEIGAKDQVEAESIIAKFEKEIRNFELRSHEGKTKVLFGAMPDNLNWEYKFDSLLKLKDKAFLNGLFGLIETERLRSPNANIVGYALSRFAKKIAGCADKSLSLLHLQRLLFAAPRFVSWIAPLFVGLKGGDKLDEGQKRVLRWGIEECARRHDTVSLLWFLYLHLYFDLKISSRLVRLCYEVDSVLVDLTLAHAFQNALLKGTFEDIKGRYETSTLSESAWLFLYEVEKRGWTFAYSKSQIGTATDPNKFYKYINKNDVHFYCVKNFGISAFNWNLNESDFDPYTFDGVYDEMESYHDDDINASEMY